MQRLTRYPLLLKDIIKEASKKQLPCINDLKKCAELMETTTEGVNDAKRAHENKARLTELHKRMNDQVNLLPVVQSG
eukprot:UN23759